MNQDKLTHSINYLNFFYLRINIYTSPEYHPCFITIYHPCFQYAHARHK